MKKNELNLSLLKESDIPKLVTGQFSELSKLKLSVEKAMKNAEKANDSAQNARRKSAGLFQKKEAIESLQSASVDLAESQISLTEAQKVSFEYQQKLGQITKYLFELGVSNIVLNRTVVRELELRLKGASQEELDELARQEIMNVVKQLKAQEDIMNKQAEIAKVVKGHDEKIIGFIEKSDKYEKKLAENFLKELEQDKHIETGINKDKEQDKAIADRIAKDNEQDKAIADRIAKDKEQDKVIADRIAKDKEQDRLIKAQILKDEEHEKLIKEREIKDIEHDESIAELKSEINVLRMSLEKNYSLINDLDQKNKKLTITKSEKNATYLIGAVSAVALVVSVLGIMM